MKILDANMVLRFLIRDDEKSAVFVRDLSDILPTSIGGEYVTYEEHENEKYIFCRI